MNSYIGLLQQALFFGFIVVALTSTATAWVYPLFSSSLQRLTAETRAAALLGLCVLPVLSAIIVLLSALLPSLLQLMGFENDHCLGHSEGHPHFCLIHRPTVLDSQPLTLLAALFLLLPGAVALRLVVDMVMFRGFSRVLAGYQVASTEGPVRILATAIPLAFSTGLFRRAIYLSTGLLAALSAEEKELVITHEKTHLARYDSLRCLAARALGVAHVPSVRRALLADLYLATEQVCDAAAARGTKDPGRMAELLLKIERIYQHHFPAPTPMVFSLVGASQNTLPERVQALLAPQPARRMPWATALSFLLAMLVMLAGHDVLHEWLEHLLHLTTQG